MGSPSYPPIVSVLSFLVDRIVNRRFYRTKTFIVLLYTGYLCSDSEKRIGFFSRYIRSLESNRSSIWVGPVVVESRPDKIIEGLTKDTKVGMNKRILNEGTSWDSLQIYTFN